MLLLSNVLNLWNKPKWQGVTLWQLGNMSVKPHSVVGHSTSITGNWMRCDEAELDSENSLSVGMLLSAESTERHNKSHSQYR